MNYRETVLRCFAEGYDAAQTYMKHQDGKHPDCPYAGNSYEECAWEKGYHWYLAEVH